MTQDLATGRASWRLAQAFLLAAHDSGQKPELTALREHGPGLVRLSFWGLRTTPAALRELTADPEYLAAQARGEVAGLVDVVGRRPASDRLAPMPPWLVALVQPAAVPMYLPPLVHQVAVPFGDGSALYAFARPLYAMAPRAQAAS